MSVKPTSHAAHSRVRPRISPQCIKIISLFRDRPNWTRAEIAEWFRQHGESDLAQKSTISVRVNWLIVRGHLQETETARQCSAVLIRGRGEKQEQRSFGNWAQRGEA